MGVVYFLLRLKGGGAWEDVPPDQSSVPGHMTRVRNVVCFSGIDFKIRTVELDGKRIKLQIW